MSKRALRSAAQIPKPGDFSSVSPERYCPLVQVFAAGPTHYARPVFLWERAQTRNLDSRYHLIGFDYRAFAAQHRVLQHNRPKPASNDVRSHVGTGGNRTRCAHAEYCRSNAPYPMPHRRRVLIAANRAAYRGTSAIAVGHRPARDRRRERTVTERASRYRGDEA
jgi:hypothetical protein